MRTILKISVMLAFVALTLSIADNPIPRDNPGRIVTFDVAVTDKNDNPIAGLRREDFRVFEDNVQQTITRFDTNRKPLAIVLLVEFTEAFDAARYDAVEPAVRLINALEPHDWGALVSFDVVPEIVTDFTHDKTVLSRDFRGLQMPYYRQAALFDAVYFVLDRLRGVEEKKAIVLLGTGSDTMSSKRTLGDALRKAETSNTTIYTVSFAQAPRSLTFPEFDPGAPFRADDAERNLAEFAEASGGLSFTPFHPGQYRRVYEVVNADLRNQYTLSFVSTSSKDGTKLRKLRIEVANTEIHHEGKLEKLKVRHKRGYYGSGS